MINASVDKIIELYDNGVLGSPENPNVSNSFHDVFWQVYRGWRKPVEYRNTISYVWAKAARKVKLRG